MSAPGDAIDPYTAESTRDAATFLGDLHTQLSDFVYDAAQRIEVTNAVRNPTVDFDYPDLDDAAGALDALKPTLEAIDALREAYESAADKLDETNEDAANGR